MVIFWTASAVLPSLRPTTIVVIYKNEYLKQGRDTSKSPEWYYFQLQMCFETHKAANQCIIDYRDRHLKERQKRIREKRITTIGLHL